VPKISYKSMNFKTETVRLINSANEIIAAYIARGFRLTLRQLYYQFVSRDLFPADWADPRTGSVNNQRSYKRLGDLVNNGRLCGRIDWDAIEDRTRNLESLSVWGSPAAIVRACSSQFRRDLWDTQAYRVEVWIEKDALAGVFEGVCEELRVPYLSCRGYTSQSEMWRAAQRLVEYEEAGKEVVILHFGDLDPSGVDMSRDIEKRLGEFGVKDLDFKRLALNQDQIERYNPPPNPVKMTDSRSDRYTARFGDESWELDALEPEVLATLVRTNVAGYRDDSEWETALEQENEDKRLLGQVAEKWNRVTSKL
jgi:hypothetical protein